MAGTGFKGEVRVCLGPSRTVACGLIASHLVGACSLVLLSWPREASWLVLLGLAGSLIRGLRREAWRCSLFAVRRVDLEGGGQLRVVNRQGERQVGVVLAGSFVAPFLVILHWRALSGSRARRYCVIPRDATDAESHRVLRVLLRHPL